jgi:hypothetical protein
MLEAAARRIGGRKGTVNLGRLAGLRGRAGMGSRVG